VRDAATRLDNASKPWPLGHRIRESGESLGRSDRQHNDYGERLTNGTRDAHRVRTASARSSRPRERYACAAGVAGNMTEHVSFLADLPVRASLASSSRAAKAGGPGASRHGPPFGWSSLGD
jgi:hypothetical protein